MKNVKSCTWFYCSAIVFALWIITAFVAPAREHIFENIKNFFVGQIVYKQLSDPEISNPCPSVKLVVHSAPWCLPCQKLKPTLSRLAKQGYQIKIVESQKPITPSVPYLEFYLLGELAAEFAGVKSEAEIREIFAEIEGSIFQASS